MAVETAILSRVRLSTGMETSNPCGLLFSTGGESPNLPGLELSWLWGKEIFLWKRGILFVFYYLYRRIGAIPSVGHIFENKALCFLL